MEEFLPPDALRWGVGLAIILVAAAFALRRAKFLVDLIGSGNKMPDHEVSVPATIEVEAVEVLGQKKLLKWTLPGIAHVFVFIGFLVLGITVVEAFFEIFIHGFAFPFIGTWPVIRFLEDLFILLVLIGVIIFLIIRANNQPAKQGRWSRFYGSHTSGAWLVLIMIVNVIWTLVLYRSAKINLEEYAGDAEAAGMSGGFVSEYVATLLAPLGPTTNAWLEVIGVWLHVAVILGFLVLVLHSKHLHIFTAPINVGASRRPNGLGPLLPMYSDGERINLEDPPDTATFGAGRIEDFTWKGLLDMSTCTECGRCQSQCPAWNTEKPLSPKLMIMNLRDHAFAKAPYTLAAQKANDGQHPELGEINEEILATMPESVQHEVGRELVGARPDDPNSATDGYDDHFVDMRRHQVMINTEFPSELNGLFKNLENKGNPWGMNANVRNAWIEEVDFPVRVFGMDGEDKIPDDVEYLFWVGCAGAYEDRAKETTKAVAELLHTAGVNFMVLGEGETCTGDPARRAGNEPLFFMQAYQNVEVLNEVGAKKIVVTCPHCLNTLGREYPEFGGNYEVVHYSQLLHSLVYEEKLVPMNRVDDTVTYHDPCYLGRHNEVYTPPRALLESLPGANLVEMERSGEKSFCCGAGGARMWMEETLGTRVNQNRADEAIGTGASKVAVACPFCSVMLNDGVTVRQQEGQAENVEVVDLASLMLSSVKDSETQSS
jgi:Fe-S oxidoreductase